MLLTCGYPDLMMSFNHQARKIMEHTTCLSGLQFIRLPSSFRRHNVYCLELDSFPLDSSPVIILPYVYSKFLFSSIVVVVVIFYVVFLLLVLLLRVTKIFIKRMEYLWSNWSNIRALICAWFGKILWSIESNWVATWTLRELREF